MNAHAAAALRVALVAGEPSGDQLGFKLMRALRAAANGRIEFFGVGGEAMAADGMKSFFPMSEIAVMGILPVLAKLPTLLARIRQTADAIIEGSPDALVIIDSPDFTHRVARRVRATLPRLPVVNYGSPTVWAWRPGRAKAMRGYVDCVLALLPFEPAAHERLGGPRCVYVGHPLIERLDELRPNTEEAARRAASPPRIVVLPGSRRAETARLMEDFGAALTLVSRNVGAIEAVLPTLPHVEAEVRARAAAWSVTPRIVVGEAEKLAAFRGARAALAKSGTGTLELALAGVPMVGAYKIARRDVWLKYFVSVSTILLPNLILGERAIPELLQRDCTPAALAGALEPLMGDGPERRTQLDALARLDQVMRFDDGKAPSAHAAAAVLETIAARTQS
ncbi:MAG: lipid-A-disaccharide synthase [Roseiarcus sp.]